MKFKPSPYFQECIERHNARSVLRCITTIMLQNPGNRENEIKEAFIYADKNRIKFDECVGYDTWEPDYDKSHWNEDYYAEVLTYLEDNFSDEHLEFALKVGQEIAKNRIIEVPVSENPPQGQDKKNLKILLLILLIIAIILTSIFFGVVFVKEK